MSNGVHCRGDQCPLAVDAIFIINSDRMRNFNAFDNTERLQMSIKKEAKQHVQQLRRADGVH